MNIEQRIAELEARVSRLEKEATEKEVVVSLQLDGKEIANQSVAAKIQDYYIGSDRFKHLGNKHQTNRK
ncbi:hypothetical protein QT236_14620 [Geobacillus stearothermophilus]|nr:hypothetical protein QT236_12780 [Geobacillus stearothermophilus]WJQ03253.1 hypothetical protein QT236_14620 [Geobacillus stearothermophilus]